ncbi:MAG: DUF5716 family protein [Treponema sp.]|nr:DUF5716 family protein [Treponema sp.]
MSSTQGVFAALPSNFFSPLASPNREHYAALLVLYYRLFQENARALEREQVMHSFTDYLGSRRDVLAEDFSADLPEKSGGGDDPAGKFSEGKDSEADQIELGFDAESVRSKTAAEETDPSDYSLGEDGAYEEGDTMRRGKVPGLNDRGLASRFLRRLIGAGWLSEETLTDYTQVINITPQGRPFFEALVRVEEGLKTEYESHVVAVYSLLCADAAAENGHYAAINAHTATMSLIDSLKVLSGSIKGHYDRFTKNAAESAEISSLLHLHYDLYANDILDGAYKRLKTSDNLSRYRPRIIKKIGGLLADEEWLTASAQKLCRMRSGTVSENRLQLQKYLEEIRDSLRAVDPLLDEIDHRNMLYAKASTERVKTLLEPESSVAGKVAALVKALYNLRRGDPGAGSETKNISASSLSEGFSHHIYGIRGFAPESLYRRHKRETALLKRQVFAVDEEALKKTEDELLERLEKQLSMNKVSEWLDERGGSGRILTAADLVWDEDSFIRFLYSILYAEGRQNFSYRIEDDGKPPLETQLFVMPDLRLRRKR